MAQPVSVPKAQPPLDPAVIKLIEALARAQAREDHAQEIIQARVSSHS
jgi:hypothetical protein